MTKQTIDSELAEQKAREYRALLAEIDTLFVKAGVTNDPQQAVEHADPEALSRALSELHQRLGGSLRSLASHRDPIGFHDVCHGRAAGIKDSRFEADMRRFWLERYGSTIHVDTIHGDDEYKFEHWSFEDEADPRYECRERPVVHYMIRDNEAEGDVDLFKAGGEYREDDDGVIHTWDYACDQRDEAEDAIGRMAAEFDLDENRFEIEQQEQDDEIRWGVWDTESDEWADEDGGDDYVDSYDPDDEQDVENAAEQASRQYADENRLGFPFAWNYCWDVSDNKWDWPILSRAGYTIAHYSHGDTEITVAGLDGGGYCFDSSHKAPAYLMLAAEHGWTVETEHGPRKVKADPMGREPASSEQDAGGAE